MSKRYNEISKKTADERQQNTNFADSSDEPFAETADINSKINVETVIENVEKPERLMYLGPDIPGTLLCNNPTLIVTKSRFQEMYKQELEKNPEIMVFLTPPDKISAVRSEIESEGAARNIMYRRIKKRITEGK